MYAASLNPNPSIVSLLVDAGADLGARTVEGWTPLMEAASGSDNVEVVRELLRSGSEVDAVNAVGATALALARVNAALASTPLLDRLRFDS